MKDARPIDTLRIVVRFSPETNDHEVILESEAGNLVERFDENMIGLDPEDILVEPCPLLPDSAPRPVVIGRCGCGYTGCGNVTVTISPDRSTVVWKTNEQAVSVRFDAEQYVTEVQRALADFSWETPDRKAARIIAMSVDQSRLNSSGLKFCWVSGRIRQGCITVKLAYSDNRYEILVHLPWRDETPEAIAVVCCELLRGEPRIWNHGEWFPTVVGSGVSQPDIIGPGWRPGTR